MDNASALMVSSVRNMGHQNIVQAKVDCETYKKFDKSHGKGLKMQIPKKPIPKGEIQLQRKKLISKSFLNHDHSVADGVEFSNKQTKQCPLWEQLISRTMGAENHRSRKVSVSDGIQKEVLRGKSYRITDPSLLELNKQSMGRTVTGCNKIHFKEKNVNTFNIT